MHAWYYPPRSTVLFAILNRLSTGRITSFRVPVSGGYGVVDTEGWIPGYRTWDGHRGFRTSGVVDEQQLLI